MAQQDNTGIKLSNVCIICGVDYSGPNSWQIYRVSKQLLGMCHDCVVPVSNTIPKYIPQKQHHRYIKRVLIKRREKNEQTL